MKAGTLLDGTGRLRRGDEPVHHFLAVSSFAEYAVVPESGAVAVSERIPLDRAALISCAVLTGVGAAVNTAQVQPGPGSRCSAAAGSGRTSCRARGSAGRIVAVDVQADKLELARRFGATDLAHAGEQDPVAAIRELTGGVDHAFEAAGRETTIQKCVSGVAKPFGSTEAVSRAAFSSASDRSSPASSTMPRSR